MSVRSLFANSVSSLQGMPVGQLWLSMVAVSLAMSEAITAAMEWLLLGHVTADYLLTGMVASVLVASLVVAIILYSSQQTRWLAANLAESEERYRLVSDLSSDFIYRCSRKEGECFHIDWLAGSCEKLFGLSEDELKLQNCWRSSVCADDLPIFDRNILALTPGEASECELRVSHTDGSIHHIRAISKVLRRADGEECYLLYGSCQDITDLKRAERIADRERRRLQTILRMASDGIHILDSDGVLVEANEKFLDMLGYDNSVIGKLRVTDWDAQDSWMDIKSGIDDLVARHGKALFETRHRRQDGGILNVEISASGIEIDGKTYIYASSRDVTERKLAEDELRIAAVAFESQNGMMITDPKGIMLRVNPAFTRLTGYSAEEAIGQTPALLNSGRQDRLFYQRMWDSLKEKGSWQGEMWNKRKNGQIYAEMLTITAIITPDGAITHYVGSFTDITEDKKAEAEIHRLAYYDPLTRLPNRRLLQDRLGQAITATARSGLYSAIFFIDLDNFKTLNDTRGHDVGDLLLVEVAQRLRAVVREGDTVARQGGDEFVVLMESLGAEIDEAAALAKHLGEKLREAIDSPIDLNGYEYHCKLSIGVGLFDKRDTVEDLFKRADLALYQAKNAGRNTLRFFDPAMQAALDQRSTLETELRRALKLKQLQLYYQPQVDAARRVIGVEALLRWQHPQRGLVPPDDFIPLAEDTGLILPIGLWVLETACTLLKSWENDARTRELQVAVNVSARQFRQADFVAQVRKVLEVSGANPARLKLELTESLVLEDVEDSIAKMQAIKQLGVSFAMDDFGTGYSSLSYLARLPLDQLKIDRSFVRNLHANSNEETITRTIITMGRGLAMDVIAEGVETEAQHKFLEVHGCHAYQGYLFSRPLPLEELEEFVKPVWREFGDL